MPIKKIAKTPLFDKLVEELKQRETLHETAREATNTLNRHNTKTGKTFIAFMQSENLPTRTKIVIDGTEFMYATVDSRVIDPKQWHKLLKDGEITEEQFYSCMNIGKKDASLIVGEDQVERLSVDKTGTAADIRRDASNAGMSTGVQVVTPEEAKPTLVKKPVQMPARSIKIGN